MDDIIQCWVAYRGRSEEIWAKAPARTAGEWLGSY